MIVRRLTSPVWFVVSLGTVYVSAYFVATAITRHETPGVIAAALTIDLVVLIPILYYLVLVRTRGWPVITVAPVFLLSFGAATIIVPAEHQAPLTVIGYALPAVELVLVGYVVRKVHALIRASRSASATEPDFYDRTRRILVDMLEVPVVARAVAYEISVIHYAFAIRRGDHSGPGQTYHRRSGYGAVLAALLMAASVELVAMHILLQLWSQTAALIHLGLSLYCVIWLVGDYRAMLRRPHEIGADGLRLRCGMRWGLTVPWGQVTAVHRRRRPLSTDAYLSLAPIGSPNYILELGSNAVADGPYGITRDVRSVGVVVDDPEAFEALLSDYGVPVEHP